VGGEGKPRKKAQAGRTTGHQTKDYRKRDGKEKVMDSTVTTNRAQNVCGIKKINRKMNSHLVERETYEQKGRI